MSKVNAVLIAVLMTCALLLVTSQHRARKAFIELERAQAMARKHEVEWNQLQLEQTQLAKHSRIDAVARRELKMQPVTPERTLYVNAPAGVHGAAAAQAPGSGASGAGAASGTSVAPLPAHPQVAVVRGVR
ncbi:MAG: cell division protein FtsL [Pseudomonadota bacterium]|jgi:cell division protein FtsL